MWPLVALVVVLGGAPYTVAQQTAQVDRYGDALPPRAVARLGTDRLRLGECLGAIAYSPDGKLVAATSYTGQIIVWELPSGRRRFRVHLPAQEIHALRFSPDGCHLVSASRGTLQMWDIASGKDLWQVSDCSASRNSLVFSPDGKQIAAVKDFKTVCLLDAATGKKLRTKEAQGSVRALAFAQDGKVVALAEVGGEAGLWDFDAGKLRQPCPINEGSLHDMAFSPDASLFAHDAGGKELAVYDASTGKVLQRLRGHTDRVSSLRFSPDGKTLVSAGRDYTVRVWDLTTGKQRAQMDAHGGLAELSPDGKQVATGGTNAAHAVLLWDAATGKRLDAFPGQTGPVTSAVFSPDGKLVATCAWLRGESAIWLWEADTGKPVHTFPGHKGGTNVVAFSPDGKWVASGGSSADPSIRLWDVKTGAEVTKLEGHPGGVRCLAFSPDGKRLASGDSYIPPDKRGFSAGRVRLWDPADGRMVHEWAGHLGPVHGVCFTPDGGQLLVAAAKVACWDVGSGKAVELPSTVTGHWSITCSGNGKLVATKGKEVGLWELQSGTEITLPNATADGSRIALTANGRFVAVGTPGGVRVYDLASGKECLALTGLNGSADCLALSPDGRRLVAGGGRDTTCIVWDVGDVLNRPVPPVALKPADVERLLRDLGGTDGAAAHRALWALAADPDKAVPALRGWVTPLDKTLNPRIERWIKNLDSDDFEAREQGSRELAKVGANAVRHLRAALRGTPSTEQKARIEALLEKCAGRGDSDELRALRAVMLLERIGTKQARGLLKEWAGDTFDAQMRHDAQAALERLNARAEK